MEKYISIIIPAYNEEAGIKNTLIELIEHMEKLEYTYEIKCKCEILTLRIYADLLNNVLCGGKMLIKLCETQD